MKIGIFGNTNNYPLLLALGLRELGHDVVLLVNRTERLHRPESKFAQFSAGYPEWIVDCSDIAEDDWIAASPRLGAVINDLAGTSDALILNDIGPSLLEFCELPALVVITGSDLSYYGNLETLDTLQRNWSDGYRASAGGRFQIDRWRRFIERQRAGIRSAAVVSAPVPGLVPALDTLLAEIGVDPARRHFVYMADTLSPAKRERRSEPPLRVVNGARLNWQRPLPPGFSTQDHKGTDILLRGFADFLASGGDAELVMFRKGLHVAATEQLARDLAIERRIIWRDEVSLREFQDEIARADIVCDQLGDSFPGMVALDAMALGVPVIANFHQELMTPLFPSIPACHARTPDEVAGHLLRLAESEPTRVRTGLAGRTYARTHLSPAVNAARCLERLGLA